MHRRPVRRGALAPSSRHFGHITLSQGDITQVECEAIVNAANEGLLGGGGVDGAIHRAAGPELLEACRALPAEGGVRCPTGQARITPGFGLLAEHVIHSVGPVYVDAQRSEPLLKSAYRACLSLAHSRGIRRIAFPAISCGVYGYPAADAAKVALSTCKHEGHTLEEIRFVLFSEAMYNIWVEVADACL